MVKVAKFWVSYLIELHKLDIYYGVCIVLDSDKARVIPVFSCDFETAEDISFVDSKIHKCYIEHVKLNLTYPTQWRS
jgi:hypothetical protein